MILLSASKVWLLVQRDGGIWRFLTWTKNISSLHRHLEMTHEVVKETLLILQENILDLLLELGVPVSRWVFSVPDLLQQILFVNLRVEMKFPFCFGNITSSMSATSTSPFQILPSYRAYPRNNPGKTFFPNWWILDWSFIGWHSTNEPNGMVGPSNGFPKRLS